jgi:transposase InsO family protein
MFLILVDAHSKWPEVFIMQSTSTEKTIGELRQFFSAYGLPEQLVSDNGSQFTSEEFAVFMKRNGIKHVRSSPYHPATNGLAERFVQSLKQALKSSVGDDLPLPNRLYNFLLTYRSTAWSLSSLLIPKAGGADTAGPS